MVQLVADDVGDVLREEHARLDRHFRDLAQRRAEQGGGPSFVLEHGLSPSDVETMSGFVRRAVARGLIPSRGTKLWLPFAVYATEAGYEYDGTEFWPSFSASTPGWERFGDRNRVRDWFRAFNAEYGGAVPRGAFAQNFKIIAWPLTHAILPADLQRHLAQLLYEFRMGLTTTMLEQPEHLGEYLHARAWSYNERFRIFCSNTSLLGHVAAALLHGEGEQSPYLLSTTLRRLTTSLEQEQQAKEWLRGARHAAGRVRSRGFLQSGGDIEHRGRRPPMPNPTDPGLVLQATEHGRRLYAELPDLSGLARRLPHVFEELRTKRARIVGYERNMAARGSLANPSRVRLLRLPRADDPAFIELEGSDSQVNALLRDQVQVSTGPTWLFKRRQSGVAVEVKSRLLRPEATYYFLHDGSHAPDVSWAKAVPVDIDDVVATRLLVPAQIHDRETAALVAVGLSIATNAVIRPVGVAAHHWDGDGTVEWSVGESGLIGIRVEHLPAFCHLTLDGERHSVMWPDGERELFVSLDDLAVGEHHLHVELFDTARESLSEGMLLVRVRDPQVRRDAAELGEGIRVLTSPARPTMNEIWAPGALTILGPDGLLVDLVVSLRSADHREVTKIQQIVELPMRDSDWSGVAAKLRGDDRFAKNFDRAESLELTVGHAGVGHASVIAERGFQPLRWLLTRDHDVTSAHLIDRTDSATTGAELYRFESPLRREPVDLTTDVPAPATGGLLRATVGNADNDVTATILLPAQPSEIRHLWRPPHIPTGAKTREELTRLAQAHQIWARADMPGDALTQNQRLLVLDGITRALTSLAGGRRWSKLEIRLAGAADPLDLCGEMQAAVGDSDEQVKLARTISQSLYSWADPATLLAGFAEAAHGALRSAGLTGHDTAPRFLLTLTGRTGEVMDWPETERRFLLQQVLLSPALVRAARFAIVGTRMFGDGEQERQGF
ncbi:hypothetical protein [uncultured Microbacterium sp.]|uniref:hypothetical protein n=1 Tax=uncultured Microbacterium sp. TaxID=191216 RepID=UPI0028E27C65|nr:hypothetical protein [uncultured Microbacterium sp.]